MDRNLWNAVRLLTIGGLSVVACRLRADSIAPGEVSFTTGQIQAYTAGKNTYNSLTILPSELTETVTESDGTGSSTTTGTFSPTKFAFSFMESFSQPDEVAGDAGVTFVAGADVSYVITDPAPSVSGDGTSERYNTYLEGGGTTFTELYGSGGIGSLTGTLTAGDVYGFYSHAQLQNYYSDPSLTYYPTITFYNSAAVATPENPAPMIPALLGGLAFFGRRLRRLTSSH